MIALRRALALAACGSILLLGACKKDQPARQVAAGGEILPGSASDAMLPLDTVTSQPPLAPKSAVEGNGKAGKDAKPDTAAPDAAVPADNNPDDLAKPEG